jgi:hypothetical protein
LDPELGTVALEKGRLELRAGFGSGLSTRAGDPPGRNWAVCDRGPNLKAETLAELYGHTLPAALHLVGGAKIMPRPDLGPTLAELQVDGDEVRLIRTVRITTQLGAPLPGLPMAGSAHARAEPAFDLEGRALPSDPEGADTEGVVALADGGFWVGDEYGPSLLRLDGEGRLVTRWLPEGSEGAGDPVLPAIASRRQINRGFEALAVSPDEQFLFLAFQSPLAHPDPDAHARARHVRIWKLDVRDGAVLAQYLYPLDAPDSFRRDCAKGTFERSDIKVSELLWSGTDRLIVLERGSETTKLYEVELAQSLALTPEHLEVETRPSVEEMSGSDEAFPLPVLAKKLIFSSDDQPDVASDLEGMAWLSETELLLVSDNDFGVEGAKTSFWRLTLATPLGDG